MSLGMSTHHQGTANFLSLVTSSFGLHLATWVEVVIVERNVFLVLQKRCVGQIIFNKYVIHDVQRWELRD